LRRFPYTTLFRSEPLELADDEPLGEKHLEPVGELGGERSLDVPALELQREAEVGRKGERPFDRCVVLGEAARLDRVAQPSGMREQGRDGTRAHRPRVEVFEIELALAL